MSADAWGFLGLLVVQSAGVLIVWLKLRTTNGKVDRAASSAKEAVSLSLPTGNGWSSRVDKKLDHLIRITAETRATANLALDEIIEHKNAHVAAQLSVPIRRVK